jgi:uncharacterized membrane protein YsdA (DUF1294 family)
VQIILSIYLVMSAITFIAFALDKSASRRGRSRRRVPESTLHALELLGGFPGAIAAQQLLRHKSSKRDYIMILWLIVLIHVLCWIYWLWLR